MIIQILLLLLIHWFADFIMQTDKQAKGKSKNIKDLINHTITYSIVMTIGFIMININMIPIYLFILFGVTMFISHTIIDYVTSRINSKLWSEGRTHDFFVSIGFDQFLHQLIIIGFLYLML